MQFLWSSFCSSVYSGPLILRCAVFQGNCHRWQCFKTVYKAYLFPWASLKYNWHKTLYTLKVYGVLPQHTTDPPVTATTALADTCIVTSQTYHVSVVRTFKIYSLSNCKKYNIASLTLITMLCTTEGTSKTRHTLHFRKSNLLREP